MTYDWNDEYDDYGSTGPIWKDLLNLTGEHASLRGLVTLIGGLWVMVLDEE